MQVGRNLADVELGRYLKPRSGKKKQILFELEPELFFWLLYFVKISTR